MTTPNDYTYDHVTTKVMMEDMAFGDDAPRPGERIPKFNLPLLGGGRIDTTKFAMHKPLLLMTGSLSCPMTASSNPILKDMYEEFGQDVDFVMVIVREAHPGERIEQPRTFDQKLEHARALQARDQLPFPIAIDDVDGSVHRVLDKKPNAAWLADRDGVILYRGLWVGDESGLIQALDAAVRGVKPPRQDSSSRFSAMAMGIGKMGEMTNLAGTRAKRDLWRAAPPMAAIAWLADLYRPLPPKWRTVAALGTVALTAGAVIRKSRR